MDPYLHPTFMQQMGPIANQFGMPSHLAPVAQPPSFQRMAELAAQHGNPVAGAPMVDMSALAPLNLGQYGPIGQLAGMAGSMFLGPQMQAAGIMPMGNAGSYMEARRQIDYQNMVGEVSGQIGGQDTEQIYQTIRGGAQLAGVSMNREQREAARSLSGTIAQYGGQFAPQLLDAMAGPSGSIQAMAGQMMAANRYNIDPVTGQMGYGSEQNAALISGVFDNLYSSDNISKMQGLRAGEMGELYSSLSQQGLMSSGVSRRQNTIDTLQELRRSGTDLGELGADAGVAVGSNLQSLSNRDLQKLASTDTVSAALSKSDADRISTKMSTYVDSLSAIREVFGENGNPNAPMSQLIGGLQALTSGEIQKFDSSRLNTMVRDVQALSQASGKSIDQLTAMQANFADQGNAMGLGMTFGGTAMNVATTTGMAFAQRGGAQGFGAISRMEAESISGSLFNRGMASQSANALGAMGRIEQAGGFADNEAGRSMQNALDAARRGDAEYRDERTGMMRKVPTHEQEFRSLITAGAVEGMGAGDFNMMLRDRTSNRRLLHDDPSLQQAAFNQQGNEIYREIEKANTNRLANSSALDGLSASDKSAAASAISKAGNAALRGLTAAEVEDDELRTQTMADAIQAEAMNRGIDMSDAEARNQAAQTFGSAENVTQSMINQTYTGFEQIHGDEVREARMQEQKSTKARSGLNQAMSGLGPKGSMLQKAFTAVQKQAARGEDASLITLLGDMVGADVGDASSKMAGMMSTISEKEAEHNRLSAELRLETDPAKVQQLQSKLTDIEGEITTQIAAVGDEAEVLGLNLDGDGFGLENRKKSQDAYEELKHLTASSQTDRLAVDGLNEQLAPSAVELDARTRELGLDVDDRDNRMSAQRQIIAERRLRSIGVLGEEGTLSDKKGFAEAAKQLQLGGMKESDVNELREAVASGDISAQDRLVRGEMNRRQSEGYYGEAFEQTRNSALSQISSADGIRRSDEASDALEKMYEARDTFTSDTDALARGGKAARDAITTSENAQDELTVMARKYFQSDVGDMLTAGAAGMTEDGIEAAQEEFKNLTNAEQEEVRKAAGKEKGAEIGIGDYYKYLDTTRDKLVDQVAAANVELGGTIGKGYQSLMEATEDTNAQAESLFGEDATDIQRQGLQTLKSAADMTGGDFDKISEGMDIASVVSQLNRGEDVDTSGMSDEQKKLVADAKALKTLSIADSSELSDMDRLVRLGSGSQEQADKLGLSVEDYERAIKGEDVEAVDRLRKFSGEDGAERLEEVRSVEKQYRSQQSNIQRKEAELSELQDRAQNEDLPDLTRAYAQEELDKKEEELGGLRDAQAITSSRREELRGGLSEKEMSTVLDGQGSLALLDKKKSQYAELEKKLTAQGRSPEEIEEAIRLKKESDKQAAIEQEELQGLSLGDSVDTVLSAVGLEANTNDARQTAREGFKTAIDGEGSDANIQMLAENLTTVSEIDSLEGEDGLEKLKSFQEQYSQAKESGNLSELSETLGMSESQIKSMGSESEFLNLGELDDDASDLEKQEHLKERLSKYQGRDIGQEVAQEEDRTLEMTGTLNLVGDFVGKGTTEGMTAKAGALGQL